jgi:hypothetical protein
MADSPIEIDSEPVQSPTGRKTLRKITPSAKKLESIAATSELKAKKIAKAKDIDLAKKIKQTLFQLKRSIYDPPKDVACYDRKAIFMARYFFGEQVVEIFNKGLKDENGQIIIKGKKRVRKIWELADPTTQCTKVIGEWKKGIPCWICGTAIAKGSFSGGLGEGKRARPIFTDTTSEDESETAGIGIEPACEHILPIAQARFFLDLYDPKIENVSAGKMKARKLEYEWAHQFCNMVKYDDQYIQNIGSYDKPVWGVDQNMIALNLGKIYKTLDDSSYQSRFNEGKKIIKNNIIKDYLTERNWKAERLQFMTDRVQKIVDFINKGSVELGRLIELAGTSKCIDPVNLHKDMIQIYESLQEKVGVVDLSPKEEAKAPYEDQLKEGEELAVSGLLRLSASEEDEPVSAIADALWFLKSTKPEVLPPQKIVNASLIKEQLDSIDSAFSFLPAPEVAATAGGGKTRRKLRGKK